MPAKKEPVGHASHGQPVKAEKRAPRGTSVEHGGHGGSSHRSTTRRAPAGKGDQPAA
jgi:hypothetical protein